MKKLIFIAIFIVGMYVGAHAQTVTVQQSFVDDANSAFKEVVALRTANDALKSENEALKKLQIANDALLTAKDTIIAAQDKRYDRLAATKCSTSSFLLILWRSRTCF